MAASPARSSCTSNQPHSPTQLGIDKLLKKGSYAAAYPLHDGLADKRAPADPAPQGTRAKLRENWARLGMWYKFQPLDLIRAYFGETIGASSGYGSGSSIIPGLYFAWVGFYTTWLIVPTIVGLIVFFYGVGSSSGFTDCADVCSLAHNYVMCPLCATCNVWYLNTICTTYKARHRTVHPVPPIRAQVTRMFDTSATVAFGIIMSIWGSFFVDFWKRRQATVRSLPGHASLQG